MRPWLSSLRRGRDLFDPCSVLLCHFVHLRDRQIDLHYTAALLCRCRRDLFGDANDARDRMGDFRHRLVSLVVRDRGAGQDEAGRASGRSS